MAVNCDRCGKVLTNRKGSAFGVPCSSDSESVSVVKRDYCKDCRDRVHCLVLQSLNQVNVREKSESPAVKGGV